MNIPSVSKINLHSVKPRGNGAYLSILYKENSVIMVFLRHTKGLSMSFYLAGNFTVGSVLIDPNNFTDSLRQQFNFTSDVVDWIVDAVENRQVSQETKYFKKILIALSKERNWQNLIYNLKKNQLSCKDSLNMI